ncbi:hypothetical protein [Rhodococcus koreensis]
MNTTHTELLFEILDQVENLCLHTDIRCGHRIVTDQQLRIQCQRLANGDALRLTTR